MNAIQSSILLLMLIISFKAFSQNTVPQHLHVKEKIGWIPFDKKIDHASFRVCDEWNIEEYYQVNPSYGEGMLDIRKYLSPYQGLLEANCESDGYVIIRFVINCQGQTNRYRTTFLTLNYTEENRVNTTLQ